MARKRGTKLGITGKENIKHANKERILKANQFAKNISHLIIPMKRSGMSSRKIADALNASKVTTPQGKLWGNRQVLRLLERIDYQPAQNIAVDCCNLVGIYSNQRKSKKFSML